MIHDRRRPVPHHRVLQARSIMEAVTMKCVYDAPGAIATIIEWGFTPFQAEMFVRAARDQHFYNTTPFYIGTIRL